MKKVNKKNNTAKYKKDKKEQEIVDETVLEIFSRCTSKAGLTVDSTSCIIALETEMSIEKGLRDAILAGHMIAEFTGASKQDPNSYLDVDNFKFSLTKQGKKYVESGFKK